MTDRDHDSPLAERKARLTRNLAMGAGAPSYLIANECLLVIRAINARPGSHPGGTRWDSLRFVLADIAMDCRARIELRMEILACKVFGRHTWAAALTERLEETEWEQCCYCDTMQLRSDNDPAEHVN